MSAIRCVAPLLFIVSLNLPLAGQVSYAQEPDPYQRGISAFRAGDYEQALAHFRRAREAGDFRPVLTYNLAVTHYRLGRYDDSERLFRELVQEARWADLARYNLGLVALRKGEREQAIDLFRATERQAADRRLRGLAARQLTALRVEPAVRPPEPTGRAVLLSMAAGWDSNVIAFPDELQREASEGEDGFIDLLAYGQTYATGGRGDGVRIFGLGHTRRHFDLDFFDTSVLSAGAVREQPVGGWTIDYGGSLTYSDIDGDVLTTDVQLLVGATRSFGDSQVRFSYRPAYHDAGSDFPELDGTSHRLESVFQHRSGPLRWTAGYRFEYHDRDDRETEFEFFSHSPVRHRALLNLERKIGAATLAVGGSHQFSRYRDMNEMIDLDGEFREDRRKSNRTDFWLRGGYEFARQWQLTGEFRHVRQNDTFQFFEYDRNVVMVGVEYAR